MKGFEFPGSSNIKNDKKADTSSNITPLEEPKHSIDNSSIAIPDIVNANPYEETVVNTNPYTNVNISDVISETEVDEESVVNDSPESTQNQKRELTDDEITEIEIEKIKAERRRKIKGFRLVYVVFMAIILVILAVCYNQTRKNAKPIVIGDIEINTKDDNPPIEQLEISAELNNFYQTGEKVNVEKILVDSVNDSNKIKLINDAALTQINRLIEDNIEQSKDHTDYEQKINKLLEYIKNLNEIKFNDYKVLNDNDCNNIKEKIEISKQTAIEYFSALNSYNSKDYNNAYNTFNSITEDNLFYKYAEKQKDIICDDMIELLKKDIENSEQNISTLNEEEQKLKYQEIKGMIEQYNLAYPYLNLETNQTYNDLLQKYKNLSE